MSPFLRGPTPPNILVVDDTPANLQLLVGMLKEHGFKVRPVPDGERALRAVHASPPDLILLDITMPGMSGYEVLERLKEDPLAREIPVLFISALSHTEDKVRAFKAGGVDYITKPFQFDEVIARVRTHLELRRQRIELSSSLEKLQALEKLRDDLTHMIVHDMRSPLLGLQLAVDLLSQSAAADSDDAETIKTAQQAVSVLIGMVNQVLDVSRLEAGHIELASKSCDAAEIIRQAVDATKLLAGSRTVEVERTGPLLWEMDPELIKRVLQNLLGNAFKFTEERGRVLIRAGVDGDSLRIEVVDDGVGIPPEKTERIFDKFGQLDGSRKRMGFGLGLAFARLAVEAHGGVIGVNSIVGKGSTFWFTLNKKVPVSERPTMPLA